MLFRVRPLLGGGKEGADGTEMDKVVMVFKGMFGWENL